MSADLIQKVGLAAYNACENGFRRFDGEKEDIQAYLRAKLAFIGRTALEAMREPTENIVGAGMTVPEKIAYEEGAIVMSIDYRAIWDAMISAALSEKQS